MLNKKILVFGFLILLLLIVNINKNYIIEITKNSSLRGLLINVAKISIPIKNQILMRSIEDKISIIKSSNACAFCNLSKENLENLILKNIDLRYANLFQTNFTKTNLSGSTLHHANLTGAILIGANLTNTNLKGIILNQADLSGANLVGADLSYDKADPNDLTGITIISANLSGANLKSIDLSNKNLTGTILTNADLSDANLNGVDLTNKDLTGVNLSRVDLTNQNLAGANLAFVNFTGANLNGVDLSNKNLNGAILSGIDLSNKNLTGTILTNADLSDANLNGVDLTNKDLTGVNLSRVDLTNQNLAGASLAFVNFTGANLNGVDLSNKNLNNINLSGVDLSGLNLNESIIENAYIVNLSINEADNIIDKYIDQNLNVTRYDFNSDVQYIATLEGLLFESNDNKLKLVLDLNNHQLTTDSIAQGILGVASHNKLVYLSYTTADINGLSTLVVNEYSENFSKVRNIIKIKNMKGHFGGNLIFDNFGMLYLAVGVDEDDYYGAQDLNSLRGKILRINLSEPMLKPKIVAYGIREPWGVTIDSKNRMFVLQCGNNSVEAAYLINDLYSEAPYNFGWPIFEGSLRKRMDKLSLEDLLIPIYESYERPSCFTAGVYLDDKNLFLLGDYYGTINVLKQKQNEDWFLLHRFKQNEFIWSFGLDKKTQKIFIAPSNLELDLTIKSVNIN
jgi:uncharacterized protein YjbI with pentapeptide repeats